MEIETHKPLEGEHSCELLVFRVGGTRCALRLAEVKEIVPMATLSKYVGLPSVIEGMLNIAGQLIPVVRLDRLFLVPPTKLELYTPIIVLANEASPFGLLVRSVESIISATNDQFLRVAVKHSFNDCVVAQIAGAGEPVYLLSTERLLIEEERSRIASFQATAQKRVGAIAQNI